MDSGQKHRQKEWYNHGQARCSLDLAGRNNETHYGRLRALVDGGWDGPALEAGCGNGWYYGRFGDTVGMDISFNSLKGHKGRREWKALVGDVETLPFKDSSFGLVYGFAILHHLEDIPRALREAHRVLRPGGRIAFGSENNALCPMNYLFPVLYGNWHIEKGFRRITPAAVERMTLAAGFTDFRWATAGFAVYGMGEKAYRITRRVEDALSRVAFMGRFAGFLYFTARKP